MKIQLPNGEKIDLDDNITLDEKLRKTKELTEQWSKEIEINWFSKSVKFFLDGLANYLVWHKEPKQTGKEDKEVLSIRKVEEMTGKRKSKSIPFTSLSKPQKEALFGEVSENE